MIKSQVNWHDWFENGIAMEGRWWDETDTMEKQITF